METHFAILNDVEWNFKTKQKSLVPFFAVVVVE
jgi:hypothetical protein